MDLKTTTEIINGKKIEVGDKKNLIYCQDGKFFVEFSEYASMMKSTGYSLCPSFIHIEDAIKVACEYSYKDFGNFVKNLFS